MVGSTCRIKSGSAREENLPELGRRSVVGKFETEAAENMARETGRE